MKFWHGFLNYFTNAARTFQRYVRTAKAWTETFIWINWILVSLLAARWQPALVVRCQKQIRNRWQGLPTIFLEAILLFVKTTSVKKKEVCLQMAFSFRIVIRYQSSNMRGKHIYFQNIYNNKHDATHIAVKYIQRIGIERKTCLVEFVSFLTIYFNNFNQFQLISEWGVKWFKAKLKIT